MSTNQGSLARFGEYDFHIHTILFKISATFTFPFRKIYTVHKLKAYQHFEISNKAVFVFVNRQKWLPFGDCYMENVLVQSNTSGHKYTNSSTQPWNGARWLFPDFPASFSVHFRHFACKLQEFENMYQIKICISTFKVSVLVFLLWSKVYFWPFFIEEIDCSLYRDQPPWWVSNMIKNLSCILYFLRGEVGWIFLFFMEETGWVKTDLGECNLKVTCPDGECSEILVSNPDFG